MGLAGMAFLCYFLWDCESTGLVLCRQKRQAMAKVHVTRKDLKKDAFQEVGLSFLEYWEAHWQRILLSVLVVVMAFLAIRIGFSTVKGRRAKAANQLVEAQSLVQNTIMEASGEQQDSQLRAAIARAEEVQGRYGTSAAGIEALYIKGNALYMRKEYDQAVSVYQNYVDQSKSDAAKAKGNIAIAYSKESKYFLFPEDRALYDQAMEYYTRARDLAKAKDGNPSYLAYQAMLGMARLTALKGDTAQAESIYRSILKDRPLPDSLKVAETEEEKEIDPEDREARLKEIRNEIRKVRAQFSFDEAARSSLRDFALSTDLATSPTKTN